MIWAKYFGGRGVLNRMEESRAGAEASKVEANHLRKRFPIGFCNKQKLKIWKKRSSDREETVRND